MLRKLLLWARDAEPVAVASGLVALVGGAIAPAVADLPPEASWTAVASAVAFSVVRWLVTSNRTLDKQSPWPDVFRRM